MTAPKDDHTDRQDKVVINISTNPKDRGKWFYWLNWPEDVQLEILKMYGIEPPLTLAQRLLRAFRRHNG